MNNWRPWIDAVTLHFVAKYRCWFYLSFFAEYSCVENEYCRQKFKVELKFIRV